MKAYVTRDSASAGDDHSAPHARGFSVPDDWSWETLVHQAWLLSDLPKIAGGKATWALSSNIPLAVAAQEWDEPALIWRSEEDRDALDKSENEIRLHWTYFAQLDPDIVLGILRRLRLKAVR